MGSIVLTGSWPVQCLIKVCHRQCQCSVPRNNKFRLSYKIIFMEEHPMEMSGWIFIWKGLLIFPGPIAMPSSRRSSRPRDQTRVSYLYLHWQVGSLPLAPRKKLIPPSSVESRCVRYKNLNEVAQIK